MKITLAGYNLDVEILKNLAGGNKSLVLTPETISAAYARISRSSKSVGVLRKEARQEIEKARKSNRRIIFEMSHHSIAEHAVFNFDIVGISRRAVEELEKFRLCSYTEKSQRYVKLKGDFTIPEEIKNTDLVDDYCNMIARQNDLYQRLFTILRNHNLRKNPDIQDPRQLRLLENAAKEDARYVLSLATQTQLGATINARNLELMIRRFASHELAEMRTIGQKLYHQIKKIAPSIILFFKANEYDQNTYSELQKHYAGLTNMKKRNDGEVILENYTEDGDERILAALLFRVGRGSYQHCLKVVRKMTRNEKIELFKKSCQYLELYDTLLREFEVAGFTFSLIVSAGCFGQLKRHRLMTIINQDYDPGLDITIPPSIKEIGLDKEFEGCIEQTERVYKKIMKIAPSAGSYILTNAHRKRLLVSVNLRELYHISRLREDPTAQWDIRNIAGLMAKEARKVMPITTSLLGGKTDYPDIYYRLFGHYPRIKTVPLPG